MVKLFADTLMLITVVVIVIISLDIVTAIIILHIHIATIKNPGQTCLRGHQHLIRLAAREVLLHCGSAF